MASTLLVLLIVSGGFDAGARISGAFPAGGLARNHSQTAILGAHVGYSTGPMRFELGYDYVSLPGLLGNPYSLTVQQASVNSGWQFVRQPDWGLEAVLGGGYGIAGRSYSRSSESGNVGLGQFGLNFIQSARKGRLTIGMLHTLYVEARQAETYNIALSQLFAVRAGVSYVF
ncbi:MAG: hypothetical protein JSU73_05520 [candidate division WOR-3 bacterium]|nr:MAG: hypothetical protein JSU73_05520 [candidate division WOR-3 bacterium]